MWYTNPFYQIINSIIFTDDELVNIDVHLESNDLTTMNEEVYKPYFELENIVINLYYAGKHVEL